ncbi:tetratricopeptide repeat protein [Anaeromyxobacter oryzae]|uniref:Tetratricopeptide repeat protein n=1 Tax=Anaeromyxobacter oryzae TaxID=2918170 RepID=A0ABM7WSI5_9BACT|nr:tetratricopeptide repeat protein [Anaeromyxobacter oryzae]BDG02439.1 hypothetical protein AMOR_14350 [Anaeromyxobacter oryzae]
MARLGGGDEVEGLDEEFLFHLNRGSDLLARGDADAARASLEKALELRPKDAKVLGLLGQAFYRLGEYEDATIAWQRLVDENPVEPAARVNLGLAFLKAKQYPEATRQLEIALDLNPEHKKAMGYLGLALLEAGNAAKAREWFVRSGSEQMVARCDEILSGARPAPGAQASQTPPEPPVAAEAQAEEEPPPVPEPIRTPVPASVPAIRPVAAPAEPTPAGPDGALGAYAAARLVPVAERPGVAAGVLSVPVRGEVRVRLDGLFATRGRVSVTLERKRFRGRATDQPFGDGATRMHRASGEGTLLFRADGRRFTALDLGAEPAYLREEALFGFEDGVVWENGRVASASGAELDLVLLRGRGRFLLVTAGEPVALDVTPDAPLRVPLRALVGWTGALTPRLATLLDDAGDGALAVELTGQGRALVDPAAAGGPAGAAA